MSETSLFRFEHSEADDTGDVQTVGGYGHAGERFEGIMRLQPHGFSSNVPIGSHGLGLRLRGESDLAIALMLEHQSYRPKKLGVGNAVVYDTAGNTSSYLGSKGIIHDAGGNPQILKGKAVSVMSKGGSACIGSDGKTYLGGDGTDGTYSPVMTEAGPSTVVFCKI